MEKSLNSTAWPFHLDYVNSYAYWDNAFSKEECEKIISAGSSKILENGEIQNSSRSSEIRSSSISWLTPSDNLLWAYQRLTSIVDSLNADYFKFDLFGITESLQFTKYSSPDGKYSKHIDMIFNGPVRKLSLSVQLSDGETYEGGDLNLYVNDQPSTMKRDQGSVIIFPSYVFHEVTPITSGTRFSLVSWVTGAPFK
jgi:PKHD-type hydroxylase